MLQVLAIAVIVDLVLAGLKTFGLVAPISWPVIYWGFLSLSLVSFGIDEE